MMHACSFFIFLSSFLLFSFLKCFLSIVLCSFDIFIHDYFKKRGLLRCAELFANEAHITGLIPPGMYVYMSAFAFSANLDIATAVAEGKLRTKATIL